MSVAKNIEITASSKEGFEAAIRTGVERAARTIDNLRGAWVKEQKVTISEGQVDEYHVTMILTFVLSDDD
jgi:flavin-binding protein dodecin